MICPNCKREERPLVLRRGLACSRCLAPFVEGETHFAFSKENDETFHLFEDYYLWVRMLKNGCSGYNIQEPVLMFRTTADLYVRRGGRAYARDLLAMSTIADIEARIDEFSRATFG